jgi:hypothetical protein
MSDLVERLRQHVGSMFRLNNEAADRIEELERANKELLALAQYRQAARTEDGVRIEELERALRDDADHFERIERKALHWMKVCANSEIAEGRWSDIKRWAGHRAREARAVLEKGKQPSAAESVGEEIENVAIVTRTVKAGQGRVEGEP